MGRTLGDRAAGGLRRIGNSRYGTGAYVEALYEACGSQQKEIHLMEGDAHGTDMVTVPLEGELGYASVPKTEEREAREELADELMRFVREAFGETSQGNQGAEIGMETFRQEQMSRLARRFQAACQGAIRAISRRHQG